MSASREKKLRKELGITGSSKEEKQGFTRFQKSVAIVIGIIVLLFVAVVFFLNSGLIRQWTTAVTVGSEKISVAEYNYYYVNTVNNTIETYTNYGYSISDIGLDTTKPYNQQPYVYGDGTWDDQFKAQTNSTLQLSFAFYNEAKKAGYELTEEDKAAVEEDIQNIENYCATNGLSVGAYLTQTYGKGFDVNLLRNYLLRGKLSESYQKHLSDSLTYTEEDLQNYYDKNKDSIDVVDYRAFSIDGSNKTEHEEGYEYAEGEQEAEETAALEAAQAKANRALSALTGLDSFTQVASTYADDDYKEFYQDAENSTFTNVQKSTLTTTLADWLFDSARVQGDKAVLTSGTSVVVIMFDQRYREEYMLKNVRHILVQDENGIYTTSLNEEQLAELEQKAEDILAEWKGGKATEETFAALADEYSADSAAGGLYENIYLGQMEKNFEAWAYDESRKPGDTGIVETTYGYHVMYFVGDGDVSWEYDVKSFLTTEANNQTATEFQEAHPLTAEAFGLSMIGG